MGKSDRELGEAIYGKPDKAGEQTEGAGEARKEPLQGLAADEAMAAALYPAKDPRYPDTPPGGRPNDCVRDRSGRILVQGDFQGEVSKLVQARADQLDHADLAGLKIDAEIQGGKFQEADFSGTTIAAGLLNSDLRGSDFTGATLKGASLAGSDIRGIEVDSDTDISGCDFSGCRLDAETVKALSRCTGFFSAKGLCLPNRFGAEK
jgi:hypothetical protein